MRRLSLALLIAAAAVVALVDGAGRASLYTPDEPRFLVPVGPDGKATPLKNDDFRTALAVLMNVRNPAQAGDRKPLLERVERARNKKLAARQAAALATDLLRLGQTDDALNRLAPYLRDRNPDYFVLTTLGHIHANMGNWSDALRYHTSALFDSEMPETAPGLTRAQRDWWQKLDRDYIPHYYRLRMRETEERKDKSHAQLEKLNEAEDVLPLFPLPDRANPNPKPVRFVNDKGEYEPGVLAAAERAKLPADAIAIVQQLLLWNPSDSRLYWLLAELHAANKDFAASWNAFHSISWGRAYGNRKILMDHRQAVEQAEKTQPRTPSADEVLLSGPTEETAPPPNGEKAPISLRTIYIYFAIVGVIALLALVRAMSRRWKGRCGPVG